MEGSLLHLRKYPDVLRQTVIDAVTVLGMAQKEAAATYEVALSTVQRWVESSKPAAKTRTSTATTVAAGGMSVEQMEKRLLELEA